MISLSPTPTVVRISKDRKYRLLAPTPRSYGFYTLEMSYRDQAGIHWYPVGDVTYAENFEAAIDEAEEEMRCLLAAARVEFGV